MAKPNSVDWTPIKLEYVTTRCTYRQLSKKYGVSTGLISKVANREGWIEARERHSSKCMRKAQQKAEAAEVNRLSKLIATTTKAIDVAARALDDKDQFNRWVVTEMADGVTSTSEQIFAKVDTKALRDLTVVLKDLTGLMRDFYNLPTPAQAEAQRIAAARLEIDQRKAESGEDKVIEVVLADDLKEMAQ